MLMPTRLSDLRRLMADEGLDGWLVPLADRYQGEYLAPADKRLQWLTGFSGSAGMAVVTTGRAAIFVDGRYTVQVKDEVNLTLFEHRHLHDEPPATWCAETLKAGQRLAYDPWLITPKQLGLFETALKGKGIHMVPVQTNLIDRIWQGRPDAPLGAVFPYPGDLAGESASARRARIAQKLKAAGVDHLALTLPDNIAWALNVRGRDVAYNPMPHSLMILNADGTARWFIDGRKLPNDRDGFDLEGLEIAEDGAFLPTLQTMAKTGATVWLDPAWTPAVCTQAVESAGGTVHHAPDPVTMMKAHKNPAELAAMRAANARDSLAWVQFLAWLEGTASARAKAGNPISEIEAADKILEYRRGLEHFIEPSFTSISAADGNAAMCHYAPRADKQGHIGADTIYLLDSGGQYIDGTTDTTRTVAIGAVPDEVKDRYTRVLKGHIGLATLRFPKGTKGHHVDAIARQHLWQAGLDYDHGTGHGVGVCLSVHEHPQRIGKQVNDVALAAGMTITNEPGFYEAGRYGIRIENLCEIAEGPDGFLELRDLTLVPIDTRLIDFSLLTRAEVDWLNAYHARVKKELLPNLEGQAAEWLREATAKV